MNILYIWDSDYPWDVRVEKICSTLSSNGHQVHIAARNLKKLPLYEVRDNLIIHRLKLWQNDKLNYTLSFPAFFSPVWSHFINEIIRCNGIDLIIVRDLPMAIAGIWAGRRNKIPVIFDMAEDYVAMIWDIWRARKFQGFNLVVRNPYLAKLVERYAFRNSDHILVVIDEARDLVINRGALPDKVTIVSNTPVLDAFNQNDVVLNETSDKIEGKYAVVYVGGIQMGRGIQVVFEAIPYIIREIPDFLFVVIGDGYAAQRLKDMAVSIGIQDYVLWLGWIEHGEIFTYLKSCKVGVIPHKVTDHINTTIPNKIFDYMGLGLPVLAADALPMKRIIQAEKCGEIFKSGISRDLAANLIKIYKSSQNYGMHGKCSVENQYNWNIDSSRLISAILKVHK